ncbi:threonine synthase, partial [Pseudomonas aeruginosa]
PDGGLAVPEQLPQISAETLESWRGLSYADLAFEVLSRFATDIPAEDLRGLTRAAYTSQIFNSEDIVPLRPLND